LILWQYHDIIHDMEVKKTLVRLTPERYEWLRARAFHLRNHQSQVISDLIDKERRRLTRAEQARARRTQPKTGD
jgi:hypothetical protein